MMYLPTVIEQNEEIEMLWDSIEVYQIGISNAKICDIDPVNFKYIITNMSCKTYWMQLLENLNRLISVSEGVVVEYEIETLTQKIMALSKIREIDNYGETIPDRVELKRIK